MLRIFATLLCSADIPITNIGWNSGRNLSVEVIMGVCPSGFVKSPTTMFSCVIECPQTQGFSLRNVNNEAYCVYNDKPEVRILLKHASAFDGKKPPPTMEEIQSNYPAIYQQYKTAKDDFDKNFPIVRSKIEKDEQLKDAFRALQTAENVRDQSPQGYQDARIRYYTLLRGEGWLDEEKTRIANAEATPKVNEYTQMREDLSRRLNQQQQTIDITTAVKDKVLSMKDDFAYTTNAFSKQISDLKNQINIERKRSEAEKVEAFSWIDLVLNILLTIFAFAFLIAVIRKYRSMTTLPVKPAYMPST